MALAESRERRDEAPQFYELGLGEPYAVSAVHGTGTGDLLDALVASFPVAEDDEIMLVTDAGQLIRCPVHDIRKAGRATQGVILLNTAEGEKVVSVERLSEEDAAEES